MPITTEDDLAHFPSVRRVSVHTTRINNANLIYSLISTIDRRYCTVTAATALEASRDGNICNISYHRRLRLQVSHLCYQHITRDCFIANRTYNTTVTGSCRIRYSQIINTASQQPNKLWTAFRVFVLYCIVVIVVCYRYGELKMNINKHLSCLSISSSSSLSFKCTDWRLVYNNRVSTQDLAREFFMVVVVVIMMIIWR